MKINGGNKHLTRPLRWLAACVTLLTLVSGVAAGQSDRAQPLEPHKDAVTGMGFVPVPAGCFQMGAAAGSSDEQPVHEVCVDGFYIGRYEVTQAQWRTVMGRHESSDATCTAGDCPVDLVSWAQVQRFLDLINAKDGAGKVRLPTEAEWVMAARGGSNDARHGEVGQRRHGVRGVHGEVDDPAAYDGGLGEHAREIGHRVVLGQVAHAVDRRPARHRSP